LKLARGGSSGLSHELRPDVVHARGNRFPRRLKSMHLGCERLKRKRPLVSAPRERADLRNIVETIGRIDKEAVGIAHIRNRDLCVGHTRNVHEPGEFRKFLRLARNEMMKGVVDEAESLETINLPDG